ncbi:hypothetical protein ABW19_dt0206601 [Dactylella cylindrospora]|nr:hypothetical protein ABW19_dt0206601 [Dactylella cylindrospora]
MASGYYKYRCKNFYSHNCGNWVWVNNTACPECVAAGRDSLSLSSHDRALAALEAAGSFEDPSRPLAVEHFSCSGRHHHDDEDDDQKAAEEEEEYNEEAPVRPARDPCNHFASGYL